MKKSSKSDARFWRYRLKRPFFSQKGVFLGQKPPWGANENFFQKSTWNIFLGSPRCNFVPSFRKIWCADLQIWCDGRTHAHTDARAWIHRPQRLKRRDQKYKKWSKNDSRFQYWRKSNKNVLNTNEILNILNTNNIKWEKPTLYFNVNLKKL